MHFYRGSGTGAARYFDEGHRGAETYYSEQSRVAVGIDAWRSGERVGTTVLAEAGELVQWVEGSDPKTGEVKGVIRSGGKEREPLRFVEMVVNNPKSLSIVASQNPVVSSAYDKVLSRQADEIAKYLSSVAVTRIGPRGAQREVGDLRIETARVLHLTSREGDPHRHIHLMLNTRVMTPDGAWHGLHSAAIRQHIRAVNERGSRILLSDGELRTALFGEGYSLGADGEIDQARGAVELLSKRSLQVAANREQIEAAWRAEHLEREPSQRVKNGWDQQAWAEGRPVKPLEPESPEQLSERVRVELAGAGFDFSLGSYRSLDREAEADRALSVGEVDRDQVAEAVVALLSSKKSTWSTAELTAEVEAAVARSGVVGDSQAVTELVEDVGARSEGRCVSVLDPALHTPSVMSRHLSSEAVLEADMALNLGLAGLVGKGRRDDVGRDEALARGLGAGQGEAVAAMSGTRDLEVVIGPAGTGKTTMLFVAKGRLDSQGREMLVVAPTLKAAQVAGKEVGTDGASLSKLLYENGWRWDELGRFSRLNPGEADPATGRYYEGPSASWGLSDRSVVIVDEAGLITVEQANALVDLAAASGAAIRLVGDPRQLGAVGRGGVMETAARWSGEAVTLDEVHRFLNLGLDDEGLFTTETDLDYAEVSLMLREATNPDEAAERLFERGAVVVHESEAKAVAVIANEIADELGRETTSRTGTALAVTVATNKDARAINRAVRELRVAAGEVDDSRTALSMDGERIGRGDRIVTRRNDAARDVANRESWTVEAVTTDGTVAAVSGARHVHLEAAYLARAAQLGYASTDYGNQGVTTDRSLTFVTDATTAGGLYVGATRGRYENTLHMVAADYEDAHGRLVAAIGRDRADRGLDAARSRAEADVLSRIPRTTEGERPLEAPEIDVANWRSASELDAAERAIERRLRQRLLFFNDEPVMPEHVREQKNEADRAATAEARQRAAWHRGEAGRIHAGRDELLDRATADYFAARDDARVVEAGPGLFNRKAARVQEAKALREETARAWNVWEFELPGSDWKNETVQNAAYWAVERVVAPAVRHHGAEADREERAAADLEKRVITRDRDRERAIEANKSRAGARQDLVAAADELRATVAHSRQVRAELVETMTSEEVAEADQARDVLLDARQRQLARRQEQVRQRDLGHRIDRGGPGIGL
jgi:exodeoxyribonuclease V alpha subunit